jgi:RNA polymerase sigma-70 factor (ECF subfamily)
VRFALRALSPEHREVVELTFYQGLSYQEIAEIMQCPVNTVKTRMFYAKKKLQEGLEKEGIIGGTI